MKYQISAGRIKITDLLSESLETYVFIKEFMDNAQMYQIFDDRSKRNGIFANRYYYIINSAMLNLYWSIGKCLTEEILGEQKPEYGKKFIA